MSTLPGEGSTVFLWSLDPLPDFLLDHTLTEREPAGRLREVVSRWVQFVGALWRWRNAATFALRAVSGGEQVRLWLIASAHEPGNASLLQDDMSVLLRAHGLGRTRPVVGRPGAIPLGLWPDAALVEVRQHENERLWQIPGRVADHPGTKKAFFWVPSSEWRSCRVTYPWWAPGGPFLLPMEKLISQPVPASLTVYLKPTELTEQESAWLAFMARSAQSYGDQQDQAPDQVTGQRKVDPAASLAGRIFMANFRRLSDKPFLVSVHCAAAGGRLDAALSLAGTMESIVYEAPFDRPQQDDERLPSAATVRWSDAQAESDRLDLSQARRQYTTIQFPAPPATDPLARLAYLADARGAATAFRLPVNVRGGVPGVAVQQRPPDFHPGPRAEEWSSERGEILLGRLHQGGVAKVHRDQFCKHALITGFTGSGKTVTVLNLVHQLHAGGVPVLAIESAKQEYRGLLGVPAFRGGRPLWAFTVGDETCAPIRLNPFELLPGVRVEAHIGRLQTCFEAALPPIGPLASMIGEALIDVYERRGWRLTDIAPGIGEPMYLAFPTMADFYARMACLTEERGYQGDVRSNVSAAVLGRIRPLTIGGKGLIFRDRSAHIPGQPRGPSLVAELFERSAVVELNDLNVEDKALVVMFLLTFLREHRDRRRTHDGRLVHVTVLEEAHNILENVQSSGTADGGAADTRYKAVQAFSNMLSEIRALGEGLIIADQSPEKLAPDAMRNTNLQLAHQLRDSKDREAVARAMIMDDEQRDFLGKLAPGQAALFVTGLQKATFLQAPKYYPSADDLIPRRGESSAERESRLARFLGRGYVAQSDAAVRAHMDDVVSPYRTGPFDAACSPCPVRSTCDHRMPILRTLASSNLAAQFAEASADFSPRHRIDGSACRRRLTQIALETARDARSDVSFSAVWCAFLHLWHRDPTNWAASFPSQIRESVYAESTELDPSMTDS